MLKHGRAGVPMEVMGLMLGEFIDDYTVTVIDVFAMPQSGTGVSVEAVDPVFQTKMLDMLKQTGRPEMVVGWYHSHVSVSADGGCVRATDPLLLTRSTPKPTHSPASAAGSRQWTSTHSTRSSS